MHPILVRLVVAGRVVEVHTFGVVVALAFAAGTLLATREAARRGVEPALVRDLCLWGLAMSLVGARLFDVLVGGRGAWDDCLDGAANGGLLGALDACTRPLRPWEGGLVFYGGVLAGLLTVHVFTRRHGLSFAATMDLITPSVPLGHVLGRIGCFLGGCCWGQPTTLPWGVSFGAGSVALREMAQRGLVAASASTTARLHPTQLYEAAGELLLFALVMARRRRTRFAGELALTWIAGYAVLRFVVELFRGDPARGWLWPRATPALARALGLPVGAPLFLSSSQAVALVALAIAVTLLLAGRRRFRLAAARSPAQPVPAPRG